MSRYDFRRDPTVVRKLFFESHGINIVLDVGANAGQYAQQLRKSGYGGRIISFEPLSSAFATLKEAAKDDPKWQVHQCALGAEETAMPINIAKNSWSSSLLDMLPMHETSAPDSSYVGKETVNIHTLDSIFPKYYEVGSRVFLKIDTQGFTKKIFEGAEQSLRSITGLQVELSLVPLYSGEPLIGEIVSFLYEKGFSIVLIKPEFTETRSGQQLQVDGLFFRL